MDSRRWIGRIALVASCWALGCADEPTVQKPTFPPDGTSVVFLTIDTLRYDHLSRNGHPRETTPYLDRLADEGVYSSHCYAQSSWTLPSMLSIFASIEPAVFGVTRGVAPIPRPNRAPKRELGGEEVLLEYFSDRYTTLPEVLVENGYATAGFSTNGHLRTEQGFAQGFETFDQESCMWGTAACIFDRALAWLDGYVERKRERPFFLWVHLFDPHFDDRHDGGLESPLYAPAHGYADLFAGDARLSLEERTRLAYDRKLRYTDDRIAEFVEELRTRGILDRVVLIIAVDHGEEFNEKGRWGHSRSLSNTLVRVPLIFRFPMGEPRGVVDVPVRNLDVAPTLIEALGLPPQPGMQGTSLLRAFRGDPFRGSRGYGETRRFDLDLRFLVDPERDRKLVLDMKTGQRELYHLSDDPDELTNLATAEPETAATLERALRTAIAEMESQTAPASRVETLSAAEIQHLRELGYLE